MTTFAPTMALRYALAAFLLCLSAVNAQSTTATLLTTPTLLTVTTIETSIARTRTTRTSSTTHTAFWTYTLRRAPIQTTSLYTYRDGEVTSYTRSIYRQIKTSVTPTVTPIRILTDDDVYNDVKTINMYYPTGAVAESDLVDDSYYYQRSTATTAWSTVTSTSVNMYMPVTMVAPTSCPTPFTISTTASVYVPTVVHDQVTPTSTTRSTRTTTRSGTVLYYETWYLSESAAPFEATSNYYYKYYIADCSTPPISRATPGTNDPDSNSGSGRDCRYYCSISSVVTLWIIIIATVLPGLFLLGLLENWLWFRRLMMGKSAMRFGTCFWVMLSLWVLCFTRMQDARSKEDQVLLREKYKAMSTGAALKAWLKWGLRRAYPVPLLGQYSPLTVGIVPAGEPLHPAMAQVPPVVYSQPPPGTMPPPGLPGVTYYYDPQHGYVPMAAGYFGDMQKQGPVITSTSIPMPPPVASQHAASPAVGTDGVSPWQGTLAPPPPNASPSVAQSDTHATQAPQEPASQLQQQNPPSAPPAGVNEAPAQPAQSAAAPPPPPKNDPNDRSLYQ